MGVPLCGNISTNRLNNNLDCRNVPQKIAVFPPSLIRLLKAINFLADLISFSVIVMSDNCGTISVIGYANTKLVGLPTDLFKVGDEYRGVVYVNKIKVTNAA